MVQLYNGENRFWQRSALSSFVGYVRDLVIQKVLPFKLPKFLISFLYGIDDISFVFLVHPRQSEDLYRGLPFLSIFRKFFSKKTIFKIFKYFPPLVIGTVKSSNGPNGVVVSSFYLPETLLAKNKNALAEARRCIDFSVKILPRNAYIGLGAWWPIVTRRGLSISKYAQKKEIYVSTGHTGTVVSLILTIRKIATIGDVMIRDLRIALVGVGEIGSTLGKILAKEIFSLGLIDSSSKRLDKLESDLKKINDKMKIHKVIILPSTNMKQVLCRFDLGICATSNVREIIKSEDMPENFIIIDDSRPEAVSRKNLSKNKVVLEGGLIKNSQTENSYDYGFGIGRNMFGCLAETYALALDKNAVLKPTIGKMESDNYYAMIDFFAKNSLECGDFKSGKRNITEIEIREIVTKRVESRAEHA